MDRFSNLCDLSNLQALKMISVRTPQVGQCLLQKHPSSLLTIPPAIKLRHLCANQRVQGHANVNGGSACPGQGASFAKNLKTVIKLRKIGVLFLVILPWRI